MKKFFPLIIGAFAAALAAGAGFGARRTQLIAAAAAADSVARDTVPAADSASLAVGITLDSSLVDSTLADSAGADSAGRAYVLGASDDPAGAARAAAAADGGRAVPAADLGAGAAFPPPTTSPAEAPVVSTARVAVADSTPTVTVRRLAKIFGTMAPRDAARVLAELGDEDVRTLIAYLSDRQAAAVMGSIPPDRAAKITGMTMRIAREAP